MVCYCHMKPKNLDGSVNYVLRVSSTLAVSHVVFVSAESLFNGLAISLFILVYPNLETAFYLSHFCCV